MASARFREQFLDALARSGWTVAELHRRSGVTYDVLNKLKRREGASTSAENARLVIEAFEDLWRGGWPEDVSPVTPSQALLHAIEPDASGTVTLRVLSPSTREVVDLFERLPAEKQQTARQVLRAMQSEAQGAPAESAPAAPPSGSDTLG